MTTVATWYRGGARRSPGGDLRAGGPRRPDQYRRGAGRHRRPPRRTPRLIALSARLPVPLLLGLRIAARRPRRVVLGVVSVAITISGLYVARALANVPRRHSQIAGEDPEVEREQPGEVLLLVVVIMLALAAVNVCSSPGRLRRQPAFLGARPRAFGATPAPGQQRG